MRVSLVLLLSVIISLTACNQQAEENQKTQTVAWYEMMKIHDEVMPKTSEINRLSRNLKGMKEEVPDILESQYNVALQKLEAAEEGMMTWMSELQQLDAMRKNKSHEEIMGYLNGEKRKIETVRKDMLNSIANAELVKVQIAQRNKRNNQ